MTLKNEKVIKAIQASLEASYDKKFSQEDIRIIMREIFHTIILEVLKGNTVTIREFGKFYPYLHTGFSNISNDRYESLLIKFSVSQYIRRLLNPSKENNGK